MRRQLEGSLPEVYQLMGEVLYVHFLIVTTSNSVGPQGFEHADIYQMLAYCTAADLPSGLLVYAAGEDTPGMYKIKHAGKTIEVASLDIGGTPEDILGEVRRLAARVRAHTHMSLALLAS